MIAPTLYALGNHEKAVKRINRREIERTGARMLLGEVAHLGDITVGAVVPSMIEAREKNAGWRIDYFVVSNRIADKIKAAEIHNDIFGSDHCPVELEIEI